MLKKYKYIIAVVVVVILGYNSVFFKSLQEVQAAESAGRFDAAIFTKTFWNEELMPATKQAAEINKIISLLQTQKEQTFEKYSRAIGIGNIRYFLVKGKGEIASINENEIFLSLTDADGAEERQVSIATEFVYGNAVRDALGILQINDFNSTMDLNMVSEEINKKIRTEVLPPFRNQTEEGDIITFIGAVELNEKYLNLQEIEVIPVVLNIEEQ